MKSSRHRKSLQLVLSVLFLACLYLLLQLDKKESLGSLFGLYILLFGIYFLLVRKAVSKKGMYALLLGAFIVCLFQVPFLSNDYFRFLWDGEMIHLGINPYDLTPNQFLQTHPNNNCYLLDLHGGMGELSNGNYSCYPTVNQCYFAIATFFSDSIAVNLFVLRLSMFLTFVLCWKPILQLLTYMRIPTRRVFYFALNPLLWIECFGNVHFEGVMVVLLLGGISFLTQKKWLFAALFLSAAIQVKLIPLLFLPFLLRTLGWKKAIYFFLCIGISLILGFGVFIRPDNFANFLSSLELYFNQFEFNSFLLYPYLQYGEWKLGWNMTRIYAPKLARFALYAILILAWYDENSSWERFFKRSFLALMVYFLFTSTLHPWYWILPLGMGLFYPSRTILFATFLTFASYGLYRYGNQSDYRILLACTNGILVIFGLLEWSTRQFSTFSWTTSPELDRNQSLPRGDND